MESCSMYKWRTFRAGRAAQVALKDAADVENLCSLDRKRWMAMSAPVKGLRFDTRTLELMDSDGDGRVRMEEVVGAIDFLKSKGFDFSKLFSHDEADEKALAEVVARQAALGSEPPSDDEARALAEWEKKGAEPDVAVLGDATADGDAALAAVEKEVDAFFAPDGAADLVTDEAVRTLPLKDHINARYLEAVIAFSEKCVKPILGDRESIGMLEWKAIKAKFAAYRAWKSSRPVVNAAAKAALDDEERVLRYRLHLLEFLENFVNMRRLYDKESLAVFQCGTLRIDAREMNLCFPVEAEAAHAALAEKSKCCLLYMRLSRPSEGKERQICAVVTAGRVAGLYVGRNGVFYDDIGKDWEAVVTKVVEADVSLREAFWHPWRKLGEGVSAMVKKFVGDKQTKAVSNVQAGTQDSQAGGAAMASSVAAIGIGIGMVGTAVAAIVSAVSGLRPWWMFFVAIAAVILAVSVPSMVLAWFKLRKRDIGAILNASGWAVNRPMYFSMKRAREFTRCA